MVPRVHPPLSLQHWQSSAPPPRKSVIIFIFCKNALFFYYRLRRYFLRDFQVTEKGWQASKAMEPGVCCHLLSPVALLPCAPGESGGGAGPGSSGRVPVPGCRPRCCLRGSPFLCVVSPLRQPFWVSFYLIPPAFLVMVPDCLSCLITDVR